jgi:hypothetical protein
MTQNRTARKEETRETGERKKEWVPPSKRFTLEHGDDAQLRWVRTAMNGQQDLENMEKRFSEGYELVSPSDPLVADKVARGQLRVEEGKIVRQGLVLMKLGKELVKQRNEHYTREANLHQQSVSKALNRERDDAMPLTEEFERR